MELPSKVKKQTIVVDEVFETLIARLYSGTKQIGFFEQQQNYEMNIRLKKPIKEIKLKGFKEALSERLRYLFYVSLALLKGAVRPGPDGLDNVTHIFQTIITPMLSSIPMEKMGLKTDLAFGLLNMILGFVKEWKDKNATLIAGRIVKAFIGGSEHIDVPQLKFIANVLATRFQNQIYRMTISLSTDGKLRLHENDGVVKFANVVAQRIGIHIMNGSDEFFDQSYIPFIQSLATTTKKITRSLQQTFGEAQNIKGERPLETGARCLLATFRQTEGFGVQIETDIFSQGKYVTWSATDILTQTGIIDITDLQTTYIRRGHFKEELGFIHATKEEAEKRGYTKNVIQQQTQTTDLLPPHIPK